MILKFYRKVYFSDTEACQCLHLYPLCDVMCLLVSGDRGDGDRGSNTRAAGGGRHQDTGAVPRNTRPRESQGDEARTGLALLHSFISPQNAIAKNRIETELN